MWMQITSKTFGHDQWFGKIRGDNTTIGYDFLLEQSRC